MNMSIICNIFCNKLISCNISMNPKFINTISNKILDSASFDQNLFIEGCTLMAEILMKFHNEEIQDRFFESVLSNFKVLFSSKTFDKKMFSKLEYFLCSIVKKMHNSSNILNIENFLIFIDNFQRDVKLNICYTILQQVIMEDKKTINDPYLSYVLLKIIKYIHDCLLFNRNMLEKKEDTNIENNKIYQDVEELIVLMINKLDFGFDYESYFNFLCEIRANIYEMQRVIVRVLMEVHKICHNTFSILNGKNTKKSLRFVKVCIAFCQITIPSVKSKEKRVSLFIDTASIALSNNLISEADSILKNAITLLSEILNENEFNSKMNILKSSFLLNQIKKLISLLIVVPGNPDSPFQIINGLINAFGTVESNGINYKKIVFIIKLYLSSLTYLTTQLQIAFPYHVLNLDSNDEIFCGDETYMEEGSKLIEFVVTEIFNAIELLSAKKDDIKKEKLINIYYDALIEFKMITERFAKMNKSGVQMVEKLNSLAISLEKTK